ncbi:sigma-70 family RNA polymerase sigma factor [Modestobacter sp. VKM Ac-2977]|uniref:RNA polymerase sigma factor n=1 Tax=Modestobacter sp. VKM Ac-2977 TaxID=3004131 RepID=UPI0022AAB12F|nr:sigma-70 family RNA polymerase sigma factor [Modestobacter sp. VKM Ac-2977]MCZ2819224.1 sigma-70 family RNA polymerase sigma factor [Modestobacter sp. VKM Ac-2977]
MGQAEERFSAVYAAHYGRVLAFCLRRAVPDAARDAAAETFLVAWRRLDDLPAEPLPYLMKTAGFVLRDQSRSSRRQDRVAARISDTPSPAMPDHGEAVAASVDVERVLQRLSPSDRELLMLSAWDDLDAAAIGAVVGCSTATARVRLHRARRRFAHQLQQLTGALDVQVPASSRTTRETA